MARWPAARITLRQGTRVVICLHGREAGVQEIGSGRPLTAAARNLSKTSRKTNSGNLTKKHVGARFYRSKNGTVWLRIDLELSRRKVQGVGNSVEGGCRGRREINLKYRLEALGFQS